MVHTITVKPLLVISEWGGGVGGGGGENKFKGKGKGWGKQEIVFK